MTRSTRLPIAGAWLLEAPPFKDQRGVFEVSWEQADFVKAGIVFAPISACHSHNEKAGTLRGMHYQKSPHGQAKLVSCVSGTIWDVIVDLRRDSPTYARWHAETLEAQNGRAVLVPSGCAHGFLTMRDESTVAYLIENAYVPEAAAAVRWNDPRFGIAWPAADPILSERDRSVPDFAA